MEGCSHTFNQNTGIGYDTSGGSEFFFFFFCFSSGDANLLRAQMTNQAAPRPALPPPISLYVLYQRLRFSG